VEVKLYHVIYDVINDVKAAMEGLLEPVETEVTTGGAEIRKVFKLGKTGTILGAMVTDGKLRRGDFVRVMRGGASVHEGKISSLKRFQEDAKEVAAGYECGVGIEGFETAQSGDRLLAYVKESSKQKL
jgi:translation initiation factor IF-2